MDDSPILNGNSPAARPLNGWKDIAAYLGKGVRTVQRWERELGMPVHRLPAARGDIVFAYAAELEEWRTKSENGTREGESADRAPAEAEVRRDDLEAADGSGAVPRERLSHLPRAAIALAVVAALIVVGGVAWTLGRHGAGGTRGAGPVTGAVRGDTLVTYDERGEILWSRRFEDGLEPGLDSDIGHLLAFADLDSDGRIETLFFALLASPHPSTFYCFEADGRVRFARRLEGQHVFGGETFGPPWRGFRVATDKALLRRGEIWVTWIHAVEFPSVVQKLDARGHLLGEFWNAGYIQAVVPSRVGQRPVMLAGGVNNEWKTGFLAVIDRVSPSATSPAVNPTYRCADCPPRRPEQYIVLPRLTLDAATEWMPMVDRIEPQEDGQAMVLVNHSPKVPASVLYRFDGDFRLLRAEISPEYRLRARQVAEQPGHPAIDEAADAAHAPHVLRWDGSGFVPLPFDPPAGSGVPAGGAR